MGIFSLPAEPTRCSDSLLWFAPPPLATLVLLVPPSLPLLLLPLPTPPPLPSASLLPVSMLPTSPSPATLELSSLPLPLPPMPSLPQPSLPPVLSEATPPWDTSTARGRLRPSPTSATPVLA